MAQSKKNSDSAPRVVTNSDNRPTLSPKQSMLRGPTRRSVSRGQLKVPRMAPPRVFGPVRKKV